jgi:cation:H+ antiporter
VIILLFVLGLALLVGGADLLVRGAARLATAAGVSALVVGLTVVALGTSAPELAVTVAATYRGEPDLAVGNVVGSNIMNILLILGMSAMVAPLVVRRRVVRLDMPILIGISAFVVFLAMDGAISRIGGLVLLATGAVYTIVVVRHSRRAGGDSEVDVPGDMAVRTGESHSIWVDIAFTLVGLGLLVLGSHWLVQSARDMAEMLGISQLAIGLTVVAIGTSLPELATSVVASLRGQRDIAVGNVIGSNLYNLLLVLGAAAALSPTGVAISQTALAFDLPIMLAVTVACLPLFYTGRGLARWEGAAFLLYFIAYTAYVLLLAAGHQELLDFRHALIFFAVPIIAVSLALSLVRRRR